MTRAEEIIKIIKEENLLREFFNQDFDDLEIEWNEFNDDYKEYLKSLKLPTEFEEIDGRCDTSEFWSVIHFPEENIYIKISGWYDSYGESEHTYDEIKQVFPKEIKTIIYE
jgi:hypothetical protein